MSKMYLILLTALLAVSCQNPAVVNNDNKLIGAKVESKAEVVPLSIKEPIANALERITKKPFGIKISPQNSPVSPEKFSGFHNAVDFEILAGEENTEVEVLAICEGKLLLKKQATGYGGLIAQECSINGQTVTVIYGHIKLANVDVKVGDIIKAGDKLTILGQGYSKETDGERKHLHLGIHKGSKIDIRGYVQTEKELNDWIDFRKILEK